MNLDDESLLSAYLDDELDPAERLAVEWSVESSPPLAEQLRSLATARDAVAGLGRPTIPVDLAPAIAARLAADRRRARLQVLARPGRIAVAVAGLSAMAASLLFALFLLHRSMHEGDDAPALARVAPETPASRTDPDLDHPEAPTSTPPATLARVAPPAPAGPRSGSVATPHDESAERADRLRITRMLEEPDVRLVLITTDVIDAPEQIQSLIHEDARKTPDFGRITLRAGIVVDPKRPGSAEVFVVPVAEGGRRSFLDKLRGKFRDLKEEGEPAPDLVTQLTEVGHVAILQGAHASPLIEAPRGAGPFLAAIRKAETNPSIFRTPRIVSPEEFPAGDPRAIAGVDGPGPDLLAGLGKGPGPIPPADPRAFVGPPEPRPDDTVTLLVWVTRPEPR